MNAIRTRARHRVEVWIPERQFAALAALSARTGVAMRGIVSEWLAPHLQRVVAGDMPLDLSVPAAIPDRKKMFVYMSHEQYQAVRLAASRINASRNRLLYAWLKPELEQVTGRAA